MSANRPPQLNNLNMDNSDNEIIDIMTPVAPSPSTTTLAIKRNLNSPGSERNDQPKKHKKNKKDPQTDPLTTSLTSPLSSNSSSNNNVQMPISAPSTETSNSLATSTLPISSLAPTTQISNLSTSNVLQTLTFKATIKPTTADTQNLIAQSSSISSTQSSSSSSAPSTLTASQSMDFILEKITELYNNDPDPRLDQYLSALYWLRKRLSFTLSKANEASEANSHTTSISIPSEDQPIELSLLNNLSSIKPGPFSNYAYQVISKLSLKNKIEFYFKIDSYLANGVLKQRHLKRDQTPTITAPVTSKAEQGFLDDLSCGDLSEQALERQYQRLAQPRPNFESLIIAAMANSSLSQVKYSLETQKLLSSYSITWVLKKFMNELWFNGLSLSFNKQSLQFNFESSILNQSQIIHSCYQDMNLWNLYFGDHPGMTWYINNQIALHKACELLKAHDTTLRAEQAKTAQPNTRTTATTTASNLALPATPLNYSTLAQFSLCNSLYRSTSAAVSTPTPITENLSSPINQSSLYQMNKH